MNTLLMIKPDIVANGQYGEILAFILKNRFEVTNLRMVRINNARAEEFYAVHKGKEFFEALIEYITSGPVIAIEIVGEEIIPRIRAFVGATDPAKAEPGTIRHMYGISIQHNAVHASDAPESAKKELAIVFGDS
jgi:nucleoside-diphosphate kinase